MRVGVALVPSAVQKVPPRSQPWAENGYPGASVSGNLRVYGSAPHPLPGFCRSCMTTLPTATRFWRWLGKGHLDRWPSAWITKTMSWWLWKSSGTRRGGVDSSIGYRGGTAWFWPLHNANPSQLCPFLWSFLPFLPIWFHGGVKGNARYGEFSAFCLARVKGRSWGNGLLLQHDMTPCLLSPFLILPATPQSLQISPPGPGGAEDPGHSQKEGQEQHLQCGAHEGLFLLPQPPLHHLWTPGVSCFFFLIHLLSKSGLRRQKRNFKVRH